MDTHTHSHSHGHHHHHAHLDGDTTGRKLLATLALNFVIPTAQIVGGIYANSMALISDALHNFSDCVALLISYFAHQLGKRGTTEANTFGYKRAEILAAQINAILLSLVAGLIFYEAVARLISPEEVIAVPIIWLAAIGIIGNGASALLLLKDAKHNLNIRGAFIHMMGDLFTSVAVLLSGIVLLYKPWYWLDPLLSFGITIYILKNCWDLLREISRILMNATPAGMELQKIKEALLECDGVESVHHLHVWNISSLAVGFSCHVVVGDISVRETESFGEKIRHRLRDEFNIDHAILQFETTVCGTGYLLCEREL